MSAAVPKPAWDSRTQGEVVVCATGAFNGLGFNSHQSWAFWRAESVGRIESPFRCANGSRASFVAARELAFDLMGPGRLWPLLEGALKDILPSLSRLGGNVGTWLCTAPDDPTDNAKSHAAEAPFVTWCQRHRLGVPRRVARGHASLAFALADAAAEVASGRLDGALLAGVDSHYDVDAMDALIAQERLFDGENLDSLIPGEGGAAVLIAREAMAKRAGLTPLARVLSVGVGQEPAVILGDAPCTGSGLATALRAALTTLRARKELLDWVIGDLTYESYRATELQLAMPRATAPGGLDSAGKDFQVVIGEHFSSDFVPVRFGDLGAATLPTSLVLAAQSAVRGAPAMQRCLLFAGSLTSDRGAILVAAM